MVKCYLSFIPDSCISYFIHSYNRHLLNIYWVSGIALGQELKNFFCKWPNSKYFGFLGHKVSVATILFYLLWQ